MAGTSDFSSMVPGFDFLQGLFKNAGAGLPALGQWVAPTLNPEELDKRIQELKTVQFWLEQNARLIATTIQALEVQRMTLSALQTMNLPLADLADALKIRPREAAPPAPPAPAPSPFAPRGRAAAPEAEAEDDEDEAGADSGEQAAAAAQTARAAVAPGASGPAQPAGPAPALAAVDPLQWWGALTQQFAQIAAHAVQDARAELPGAAAGVAAAEIRAPSAPRQRPASNAKVNATPRKKVGAGSLAAARKAPPARQRKG